MDPLSISIGVLTILEASGQVCKGLKKLTALRSAPVAFLALNNEVADIQCMVQELHDLGRQHHDAYGSAVSLSVCRALENVKETLLMLEKLIAYDLTMADSNNGQVKLRRVAWIRSERKIRELQERMRSNRINLASALGVLNSSTSLRIDMRLQQLCTGTEMFQSQSQLAIGPSTMGRMQTLETLTRQVLDGKHCSTYDGRPSPHPGPGSRINTTSFSNIPGSITEAEFEHTSAAEETALSPNSPPLRNVQLHFTRSRQCDSNCRCSCHKPHHLKSPTSLNRVLGSLMIGYCAIPTLRSGDCDVPSCMSRSTATVQIIYKFPYWVFWRAISMTVTYDQAVGPEFCLRLLRIRPDRTDFFVAAYEGRLSHVKRLLYEGRASVLDISHSIGYSALHVALSQRRVETVDFLLSVGADPVLEDTMLQSPFKLAWEQFFIEKSLDETGTAMLRLFHDRSLLNTFGFTELHEAFLDVSKQVFEDSLLSCPRSAIDQVDAGQRSTLSWAAQQGDLGAILQLLSRGADPNKPDGCGMTPLHWAGENGGLTAMTALLNAGADINKKDQGDQTTLMHTVKRCDDVNATKVMLESGAEVASRDSDGRTAIHFAAWRDRPNVLAYFGESGGDINADDFCGYTPVVYALRYRSHGALKTLVHHEKFEHSYTVSNTQETILHLAVRWSDLRTLELLCSARLKGVVIDRQDMYGWTALQTAQMRRDRNTKWSEDEVLPPDDDPATWYASFMDVLDSLVDPVMESYSIAKVNSIKFKDMYEAEPSESEDDEFTDSDEKSEHWSDALESPSP